MKSPSSPPHFLLVEDEDDHAELVRMAMTRSTVPFTMHRVADGIEALGYLQRADKYHEARRPDVILLDLKMPKMNGHELLSKIKADPSVSTIPVVILTTSASAPDRNKAYQLHANSFVSKPVDFAQFLQVIHELLTYWTVWNLLPDSASPKVTVPT